MINTKTTNKAGYEFSTAVFKSFELFVMLAPSLHTCILLTLIGLLLCVFAVCSVVGPVEADPEYQLIVDSNNILVEIDNEISKYMMCVCMNYMYV